MASTSEVLGLGWDDCLAWFDERWEPGQHVALCGPTGVGKSTLANGILPLRKYVLALDPKGGDTTLSALLRRGFTRIDKWPPPRQVRRDIEDGKPARLIVGKAAATRADLPQLRATLAQAIDDAFDERGWTVYIDELQIAADSRMMNLGKPIERLLIAARDRGVSVVSSFQRPANVPRAASEMSRWLVVWYTRDRDVVTRLSEMAGRSRAEVQGAVAGLEPYSVLIFSNNPHDPIVVTRAPRVR